MVKRSGIYSISSALKTERMYIGSAINIEKRWNEHRSTLRSGKHYSQKLQRHFNKYGECDLTFTILEECAPLDLIVREQSWIDKMMPFFNAAPTAGNMLGFKMSKEAKRKNSIAKKGHKYWVGKKHLPESKDKMRAAKLGKKLSEETRAKLSKAKIGNKNTVGNKNRLGKTFTEDAKRRISESLKKYFANKRVANGNLNLFG